MIFEHDFMTDGKLVVIVIVLFVLFVFNVLRLSRHRADHVITTLAVLIIYRIRSTLRRRWFLRFCLLLRNLALPFQ